MLINYCNEKLHQIFIELTLKSEQEEYLREGKGSTDTIQGWSRPWRFVPVPKTGTVGTVLVRFFSSSTNLEVGTVLRSGTVGIVLERSELLFLQKNRKWKRRLKNRDP